MLINNYGLSEKKKTMKTCRTEAQTVQHAGNRAPRKYSKCGNMHGKYTYRKPYGPFRGKPAAE